VADRLERLRNMSLGNKLLKNITANYIGVSGQIVIAFFLSPFLVHTLGDEKYGIWTIFAALSGYMSILDLGIASGVTKFVARYYQRQEFAKINQVVNSALFLFVVIAMGIICFSPLLAKLLVDFIQVGEHLTDIVQTLVIIVSFDISIFLITGIYRGATDGFQRFEIVNLIRIGSMLYKASLFYLYLSNGYGLLTMGIISISTNLLILCAYYFTIRRSYTFVEINHKHVGKEKIREIFNHGKFVFISMLAAQLLYYSSSFVIGRYIGIAAITYYGIPWSLTEYVKMFCLAISRTYTPAFAELESQNNQASIYSHYISGTKLTLLISNLFCVGMIVFGAPFIALWMGAKYAEVAEPLILILFSALYFHSPQLIGYSLLMSMSKHQSYAKIMVGIAIVGLVLSIVLAQTNGLIGVAFGVSMPQVIFYGFVVPWMVSRILKKSLIEFYLSTHLRLIIPSVMLFGSLSLFKMTIYPDSYLLLVSGALLSAMVYFISAYFFTLNTDEKSHANVLILKFIAKLQRVTGLNQS
jgi:O-antigen/teichoic acid export membrane protein